MVYSVAIAGIYSTFRQLAKELRVCGRSTISMTWGAEGTALWS